jgi:DHR-2, Lobe B
MQVFNVKPISSMHFHPNMPSMVREFYENNNVNLFVYSKPFRKGESDKGTASVEQHCPCVAFLELSSVVVLPYD